MNEDLQEFDLATKGEAAVGRLGPCAVCDRELPLRLPGRGERGTPWVCTGCGAVYDGVLDRSNVGGLLGNVRPGTVQVDYSRLAEPPQAIAEFIRRANEDQPDVDSRRCVARHSFVRHVAVVPVDKGFHPVGEPFLAMTRDISTRGISLLHTRAVKSDLLVVELSTPLPSSTQVLMRVVRCQPLGRFYEIAGIFVVRLASKDAHPPSV